MKILNAKNPQEFIYLFKQLFINFVNKQIFSKIFFEKFIYLFVKKNKNLPLKKLCLFNTSIQFFLI